MSLDFEKFHGLSGNEVIIKQQELGLNVLFKKKRKGLFNYIMQIFNEPMLMLLLFTALIYFALDQAWDGGLMIAGVILIISIDLYQEAKTDKALAALKELSTPKINVIRDGKLQIINNQELVTGDLLITREGDRIAGDGIIIESSNFSVDESILTGESGSIFKSKFNSKENTTELTKLLNTKSYLLKKIKSDEKALAGTLVISGQAVIFITSIGAQTQYGKIGKSLATIEEERTPLQQKTGRLVKIFGLIGLAACIALFFINLINTGLFIDSLIKGLTLAISVIPEEIPVVLTVFAALGAYRLTQKNALIRKINAIETLGHVTTLCTDKTGTLTINKMQLQYILNIHGLIPADKIDPSNTEHVEIMTKAVLTCQPEPFDPADLSIFEQAGLMDINIDSLHRKYQIEREYAFDQKMKSMGYAWRSKDGISIIVKGSPEKILEQCNLNDDQKTKLLEQMEKMAAQGLRVLGVAYQDIQNKKIPTNLNKITKMNFVTLLGFRDPAKTQAKTAIIACQNAGITIRMITGDHPQTAIYIAKAVGIKNYQKYLTGSQIDGIADTQLPELIKNCSVFARINPEQKLRIVAALKKNNEIVAMIGDGVNDAPSLKEADVGIAMGQGGTNVAREASDLILMDDSLSTVVHAISHGRKIYDNIQKAIHYIFTVHVYIILLALVVPLAGFTPFLLPIHIVLIELIIDPTCALVYETIPAEPDTMRRKPRDPNKSLISLNGFLRTIIKGLTIFFLTAGVYIYAIQMNWSVETARTLGISIIVFSNLFLVLSSVSKKLSLIRSLPFILNRTFLLVYLIVILGLLALIYLPGLNIRFGLTAISLPLLALTALFGFIPALGTEIYKKMKAA